MKDANDELVKVNDQHGFHYEVLVRHSPHLGFSTAYYNGRIIGQVELGRILEPIGDDDREWEMYHERLAEWKDEIKVNLIPKLENHFNHV